MLKTFNTSLKKKGLAPGTVARVTELLRRLINHGVENDLYPAPGVKVTLPDVPNTREPEFLKTDELARLYAVLDAYPDKDIANLVRLALWTGMRKSEIFRLEWDHIDLERGFIRIMQSKGGEPKSIPMCDEVWALLYDRDRFHKREHPKLIFASPRGLVRKDVKSHSSRIKTAAKLPESYRLFHGSRHHFASTLVSSGVDLFTVSKLLTHKDLTMTERYAHLSDETLRNAVNLITPEDKLKANAEHKANAERRAKLTLVPKENTA
jgi:integrase